MGDQLNGTFKSNVTEAAREHTARMPIHGSFVRKMQAAQCALVRRFIDVQKAVTPQTGFGREGRSTDLASEGRTHVRVLLGMFVEALSGLARPGTFWAAVGLLGCVT